MSEVIAWLESPEGEAWSRYRNHTLDENSVFRCILITVVEDDGNEIKDIPLWVA